MHYVHNDTVLKEHVEYIDKNQISPPARSWVNLNQAHQIEIVEVGFNFYIKVVFSPTEYYYIHSCDCEKAAKHYVQHLFE